MAEFTVSMVSEEALDEPLARPFIERVAARTRGQMTVDGTLGRIRRGEWQLWLVRGSEGVVAVLGTALFFRDDGRKSCDIVFLAGKHLRSWWPIALSGIENWAVQEGCSFVITIARKGLGRVALPGYRAVAVEFVKEL